jgi:hypothetical protein
MEKGKTVQKGSAVYIRYLDHTLNCSIVEVVVRETMGWITQEIGNFVCIQHDRTVETVNSSTDSANGQILRKNCILEIHVIHKKGEQIQTGSCIGH